MKKFILLAALLLPTLGQAKGGVIVVGGFDFTAGIQITFSGGEAGYDSMNEQRLLNYIAEERAKNTLSKVTATYESDAVYCVQFKSDLDASAAVFTLNNLLTNATGVSGITVPHCQ